ncbi:PR domain zinc finger protein 1 isoform X1 [Stigmatopora argus]
MKGDHTQGDMSIWREVDFALNCTYIVPDQVSNLSFNLPKAMTSIPRNLAFDHNKDNEVSGVFSKEYIPRGTRFGPLQGDIYTKDDVPKQANRKYFWRIYNNGQLQNFIDGYNVHSSNWMRYVNPARSLTEQNLVACQNGRDVYFYTIRPVEPKQELLVWYSQEFAQRLCSQQDNPKHKPMNVDSEQENPKQELFPTKRTNDQVKEERNDEEVDVEMLGRDTPPDTPDDQIMDFSKKIEKQEERDPDNRVFAASPRPEQKETTHGINPPYLPENFAALSADQANVPLHLHGLYGHREGLVSSYPLYPQSRPLQPAYQLLPPFTSHYPRLLLPPYSPPFPGMLPSRGSLRYGNYLGTDGIPYPPLSAPNLLPMALPYPPSPQGGLKELTPNVSPPRGAPATPELSPLPKPTHQIPSPEHVSSQSEEAMNLTLDVTKGLRNRPGHKSLPYPLKKQNGKIKYECNICSKTFGQLSNLKVHLRVHSGERPFECNLCKKSFTQLAHLQKHHLVHTGEKPHECQVCQKRFSSTSNLKTHLRLHSGEKPYQCKLCGTKFTQYIHLKLHRRLHSGRERPYRCPLCSQAFFHRFSLRIHQSGCCPANSAVDVHARETLERFDAGQEADALAETAAAAQVEEAVERWLARTLEGDGKEDQREANFLLKGLSVAIHAPERGTAPAYQERASVVHLHKRSAVKVEA